MREVSAEAAKREQESERMRKRENETEKKREDFLCKMERLNNVIYERGRTEGTGVIISGTARRSGSNLNGGTNGFSKLRVFE